MVADEELRQLPRALPAGADPLQLQQQASPQIARADPRRIERLDPAQGFPAGATFPPAERPTG
ncbi:MAG: hypothetical protein ACM3XS_02425 [Bacteroidota bacterium]